MQGILTRKAADSLMSGIQKSSAIVLLGAQQVGKTTLARTLAEDMPSIYLDLLTMRNLEKLNNPAQYLMQHADKLIILDEIQNYPDLLMVLRDVIDVNRRNGKETGQFLLLGSANDNLLRQTSESLADRIRYVELGGINALELPDDIPLHRLWLRGGFPDSVLSNCDTNAMLWLESYIINSINQDISQFSRKVTTSQVRRLWTMMAHSQGKTANYNKLAASLGVDSKTVRYYINLLCNFKLLRELPPYFCNTNKRLVKLPRYYIRDSGVLHCLLNIENSNALYGHPILGKSWDGFVIENVLSVLADNAQCYFYRTSAGAEINLLIETRDNKLLAVDISHSKAPKVSKHFHRTCGEIGVVRKFVIHGGDDCFSLQHQTEAMSLPHFLTMLPTVL